MPRAALAGSSITILIYRRAFQLGPLGSIGIVAGKE
jgi:hypothetical protein